MIIGGDVGGTKTRLGLFKQDSNGLSLLTSQRYVSAEYPNFESVVERFLNDVRSKVESAPTAACFGIPGPVVNGTVKVTNLPWALSEKEISEKFTISKVKLVNDLVATAASVPHLNAESFETIYEGKGKPTVDGVSAVIAPGTGLGQALIVSSQGKYVYLATEAGHVNFAPIDDRQTRLWRFLREKLPHVSLESVLCGPGMANIYRFLRDSEGLAEPAALRDEFEGHDWGEVITRHAIAGDSDICVQALDIFCEIFGAHCSNVVLAYLATNGLFLGGGIPPKIAKFFTRGSFMHGYLYKGKCKDQVEATSIRLIEDDTAALIGAGQIAMNL